VETSVSQSLNIGLMSLLFVKWGCNPFNHSAEICYLPELMPPGISLEVPLA